MSEAISGAAYPKCLRNPHSMRATIRMLGRYFQSDGSWLSSARPRASGDPVLPNSGNHLLIEFVEQITPIGIDAFDQFELPGPVPFLDEAFAPEG